MFKTKPKRRIIVYICYNCKCKQVQDWTQLETVECGDCSTIWNTDWKYYIPQNKGYPSYLN